MLLRIAEVTPLPEQRLRLRLTDGTTIDRDASPLMLGAVFEDIRRQPELFARVRVVGGTVAWPNGADLCPDMLIWGGLPPPVPEAGLERSTGRQAHAEGAAGPGRAEGPLGAARRFAAALRERYGDALVIARLFGSCARGEMREDSDVDVAVVLERVDWRTRRDVIDLSADVSLAHDVLLSATVLDRATFEHWRRQERALIMDIERDGLPL